MTSIAVLVAGPLSTRTGGSIYGRRMVDALGRRGWRVEVHELDDRFPFPTAAALDHAAGVLAGLPRNRLVLVDGLAFGAMPGVVERASAFLRLAALVHLPLAATIGLEPGVAAAFRRSEQRALASARLVIVTGASTPALMADLGLSHGRLAVVEPGTDAAPLAKGSGSADVHVLKVATLNAGKGHATLIEALAPLSHLRWRLTCAGSVTRDPETAARVRAAVAHAGLEQRVTLAGDLDEAALDVCYDGSDLVVSASLRETYGMAVAEALARGLPVVGTATGAIPALVGEDAGISVPPGDAARLTEALSRLIADGDARASAAAGARRVRQRLQTWDQAAERLAMALESVNADE
jgi:glycosyltransferase involved in cell wall biosynthesis